MSFTPSSTGTVTFTAITPGLKTLASQVNTPFQTFSDRLNSLTSDINNAATVINQAVQGSSNTSDSVTQLAVLMGGVGAGAWPTKTYSFTTETVTGFKVSRDVFYYYQFPILLTSAQPLMRMSVARKLIVSKVRYYRDNTTPPVSTCYISVRKNGAEIGQINIKATDSDKTWIDCSADFSSASGDVAWAAGDALSMVVAAVPGSGTAAQDISILLPFEETVRLV